LLNGEDVSGQIRSREVNKYVSPISANENVRRYLVDLQKELFKNNLCVIEGRDIGSVVCPDAELKIYMFATIGARAKRRLLEFEKMGITDVTFDEIAIQINERDKYDSSRENSPLQKVESAIDVDTTELTLEQQVEKIYKLAIEIINK
jgi:cytidylate kinase